MYTLFDLCLIVHLQCRSFNINQNQLDSKNNSVYWSSRSAQHVSDKTMSIIRSVKLKITVCGMGSCCSGGLAVRRAAAWSYVLHNKHTVPPCRPPDRQPTTTTWHYTTCCNFQSYAPDDGRSFVRNRLSWSWRSVNTFICCVYLVLIFIELRTLYSCN
jgi:hypothetical protein